MGTRLSESLAGEPIIRPVWDSFEEVVDGLVRHLIACGRLPDTLGSTAVEKILEREIIASTAMVEIGVSIPHARLDGVDGITAALAVSPNGVYQLTDGLPISIVVLVLSSPSLVGEHLNFLASLSLLLQSPQVRRQLCQAMSPEDIRRLIREGEAPR